jgi:WD40 repeat protein
MQEGIPNAEDTDLLETVSSDNELVDESRLSVLTGSGPGSNVDQPLALIYKNVLRSRKSTAPMPNVSFDPSRFSSTPFQLKYHTAIVFAVTISGDGTRLVSCSKEGHICIWDMDSKRVLTPIKPSSVISSVAFAPDGKQIVSGQSDPPFIRMWDARTGVPSPLTFLGHKNYVLSVAYSPDGRRFASGSFGKTMRIWDTQNGACLVGPIVGHTDWIRSVAFSPDGSRLVSSSIDRTVRVWDAKTGKSIGWPFEAHTDTVSQVAFSPDGKSIASGSYDKTVRLWDAEAARPTSRCCTGHTAAIECIAFSADGRYVLSGSLDGTIRIWDVKSGLTAVILQAFQGRKTDKDAIWSVALSSKGDCIVAGTAGGTIYMWRKAWDLLSAAHVSCRPAQVSVDRCFLFLISRFVSSRSLVTIYWDIFGFSLTDVPTVYAKMYIYLYDSDMPFA